MGKGTVTEFPPANGQALENIPHMLRYWAGAIERDQANGIEFEVVALVLLERGSAEPTFCLLGTPVGAPNHPLLVAGMFDKCRAKMIEVGNEE